MVLPMKRTVGRRIIEGLEEFAIALESDVNIPEAFTCRQFRLALRPRPYDRVLVRRTRKLLGASQAVFAQFLGVSVKTVSAWEQGQNIPQDVACRLMDEIRHDPEYWKRRLSQLAVAKDAAPRRSART